MTPEQAFEKIRAAGLHARLMSEGIIGGGFVDRRGNINMVEDPFQVTFHWNGDCKVLIGRLGLENTQVLPLEEAVDLIIKTVPPGKDLEPEPKPPSSGPVDY